MSHKPSIHRLLTTEAEVCNINSASFDQARAREVVTMNGNETNRLKRRSGLVVLVTKALEGVGLLNKGSAAIATGDIPSETADQALPVATPALNVTRVSGFGAFIASTGAAALAIYNVDKSADPVGVVVAAYGSVGLVVSASLIAVAIILSADIRARSGAAPAGLTEGATKEDASRQPNADVRGRWDETVKRLETVGSGLTGANNRLDFSRLWRDASSSSGMVSEMSPPADLQDEHSRLLAAQGRVIELLKRLIDDQSTSAGDVKEIRDHVRDMRNTVNQIS